MVTGQNNSSLPNHEISGNTNLSFFLPGNRSKSEPVKTIQQQILKLTRTFAAGLIHRNGVGADNFFLFEGRQNCFAPLPGHLINDLRTQSPSGGTLLGNLGQGNSFVPTPCRWIVPGLYVSDD